MDEKLTKKERKEQKRLEQLSRMEKTQGTGKMKYIIIAVAVILFLGVGIFSILASKHKANAPVTLSSMGWTTGNPKSQVTVAEFGDFQCPACLTFEPFMRQLRLEYGSKVKIVFKHFPLKQAHPNAMPAAIAAEAAGKQGKFWQYHDTLYDNQNAWASLSDPTAEFQKYAKKLKLDVELFKKDLKDKSLVDKVNSQEDEGIRVGVNATPTVFVNGTYMGVPTYSELKKKVDEALASK